MHANLTIDSADDSGVNPEVVIGNEPHARRQLKAGERVLKKVRQEKNNLQDANIQLGVELKDVRAQLADSVKENKRLRRGIFSKRLNELLKSSAKKPANRLISPGMLTGRPEKEMPGSAGDLLPELSQLHEQVRQVMQSIAKALWPSCVPARRHGGAYGEAQGSAAALPIMEDIGLPTRCEGSLGHGEDAVYQG